jgi:hypothetical protein
MFSPFIEELRLERFPDMRMPMTARYRISTLTTLAMAGVLLAGCAGEATSPSAAPVASELRASPFVPTAAQKALVGASDGTYTFTVDPQNDESLQIGASRLIIPSNAICDLETSSYGPSTWNDSCRPERNRVTITAVVRNAATDHPSIDFQPALRFSPRANVYLYFAVSDKITLDNSNVVKYCNETDCVDESQSDRDLRSYVDTKHKVVYRRIKHFSGYVISQLSASVDDLMGW